jgi:hypothetical protein
MKFCKDCRHFEKGVFANGGSLLPGFAMAFPPKCHGNPEPTFNLVTGERRTYAGDCADVRCDGMRCGPAANWFEPATLDGRLAMLEESDSDR